MTDKPLTVQEGRAPFHVDLRALPWTSLRSIGNSTMVKMTIFIPLIGYAVLFNEYLVHYLELSRQIFGAPSAPLPSGIAPHLWRLFFVYFGLCFLAAASVIYQVFCPPEVKLYATATDYISVTLANMGNVALARLESRLLNRRSASVEFKLIQQYSQERAGKYDQYSERSIRDKIWEDHGRDTLELNYRSLNVERRPARLTAFAFYALGFGLLIIPSANVFWRAMIATVTALCGVIT
jgi:hypothetical protein